MTNGQQNYSAKANRYLSITLAMYAQTIAAFLLMLHSVDNTGWFWASFGGMMILLFIGTFCLGEYRHYKRLE